MINFIDRALRGMPRASRGGTVATTVLLAGLVLAPVAARGAAQVSGTEAAVNVDAQNSSVRDILTALGQQFNVHLQSTAALDRQVTGTYEGSLREVLARLLEGYNFIIRVRDGQLLVTVLGGRPANPGAASSTVAAAVPPTAAKTAAANTASAEQAATAPSSTPKAAGSKAGVPEVKQASGSGPVPTFKVAEGPPPVPQPSPSTSAGPVAGPSTSKMPMPTPGGATTTPVPNPGPSTGNVPTPPSTPAVTPPAQAPQKP